MSSVTASFQVPPPPPPRSLRIRGWVALGLVVAGAGLMRLRFEGILVHGPSMEPTLRSGDLLLLDRRAYRHRNPAREDLVIVRNREGRMVKRVVGLPGETVEVRRSLLYINGAPAWTEHPVLPGYLDIGRGRLGPGRYAVLGDNRSLSPEETVHAVVGSDAILGRVIARWSWRDWRGRWFGQPREGPRPRETPARWVGGTDPGIRRPAGPEEGMRLRFPCLGETGEVPGRGNPGRWREPPTPPLGLAAAKAGRRHFTSFVSS